ERQQRQHPGALDLADQVPVVAGAHAGDAAGDDPAERREEAIQKVRVLVIDLLDELGILQERAYLLARRELTGHSNLLDSLLSGTRSANWPDEGLRDFGLSGRGILSLRQGKGKPRPFMKRKGSLGRPNRRSNLPPTVLS